MKLFWTPLFVLDTLLVVGAETSAAAAWAVGSAVVAVVWAYSIVTNRKREGTQK